MYYVVLHRICSVALYLQYVTYHQTLRGSMTAKVTGSLARAASSLPDYTITATTHLAKYASPPGGRAVLRGQGFALLGTLCLFSWWPINEAMVASPARLSGVWGA
jgi:hypothetical protein